MNAPTGSTHHGEVRARSCEEELNATLLETWRHYAACRRGCQRKPAAKRVHAFRIASRQLLAVVTLAAAAAGSDASRIRRRIKRGLRATSRLRDLDAQLHRIAALVTTHAVLKPLAAEIGRRRHRAAEVVRRKLARIHLGRRVRRLGCNLFDEYPDGSAEQSLRAAFAATVAKVAERNGRREVSDAALHRARLGIKKLRYMAEALQLLLPGTMRWRENLRRRQRQLGDIRDLGSAIECLEKFRAQRPEVPRPLQLISARLARKRRALLQRHVRGRPLPLPRSLQAWLDGEWRNSAGQRMRRERQGAHSVRDRKAYRCSVKIILVPVDFSSTTGLLVAFAGDLAEAIDAFVVLLHVVRPDGAGAVPGRELREVGLQRLKQSLRDREITTQSLLLTGNPAAEIIDQAHKLRASYVVMGSHGHGPWHCLVLGSTTGAVLGAAGCPVVLLPPGYAPGRSKSSTPSEEAVET